MCVSVCECVSVCVSLFVGVYVCVLMSEGFASHPLLIFAHHYDNIGVISNSSVNRIISAYIILPVIE